MKFVKEAMAAAMDLARNDAVLQCCQVGSSLFSDNPGDVDFLVLIRQRFPTMALNQMVAPFPGFSQSGEDYDGQDHRWCAARRGCINLIITVDSEWYARAKLANEVVHCLRLENKAERIAVYRIIRDGAEASAARQASGLAA